TSRLLPSVQCVLLFQVSSQGAVGVIPRAEVDHTAADLLRPALGGVREEGEVVVRLGRLAGLFGSGTTNLGHGDCLLESAVTVFTAGHGYNVPGHSCRV